MVIAAVQETRLAFRKGARVPTGADAQSLVAEIENVRQKRGDASVESIKAELDAAPSNYPQFALWLPADEQEAWEIVIRDSIRKACASIIRYTIHTRNGYQETPHVRLYHVVHNPSTERKSYETLEIISGRPDMTLELFKSLRDQKQTFADKEKEVLDEMQLLLDMASQRAS